MLDNSHLHELMQISDNLTHDNIGDSMMQAIVIKAAIGNPEILITSDRLLEKLRSFARGADIGWKIFKQPIMPAQELSDIQVQQLNGIVGTLVEINYCSKELKKHLFLHLKILHLFGFI